MYFLSVVGEHNTQNISALHAIAIIEMVNQSEVFDSKLMKNPTSSALCAIIVIKNGKYLSVFMFTKIKTVDSSVFNHN